jgi:hypothetical protein
MKRSADDRRPTTDDRRPTGLMQNTMIGGRWSVVGGR